MSSHFSFTPLDVLQNERTLLKRAQMQGLSIPHYLVLAWTTFMCFRGKGLHTHFPFFSNQFYTFSTIFCTNFTVGIVKKDLKCKDFISFASHFSFTPLDVLRNERTLLKRTQMQ